MKFDIRIVFILSIIFFIAPLVVWEIVYNGNVKNFEESVTIVLSLTQGLAIIFGGWWAYNKLTIEKRTDEAVKIKAAIMNYVEKHSLEAAIYRNSKNKRTVNYKTKMAYEYNNLIKNTHLSVLPRKLRDDIFEAILMPLEVSNKNVDSQWKRFGERIDNIKGQLDKIILY